MNIPDHIPRLWYEDKDGNFLGEPDYTNIEHRPTGAYMQISEFPFQLRTTYLQLIRDASGKVTSSKQIAQGESGWPADLVNAMVRGDATHKSMDVCHAIQITAKACERCVNAIAYEYKMPWGYPEYSKKWKECGTSCQWCDETKNKKKFELPYRLRIGNAV